MCVWFPKFYLGKEVHISQAKAQRVLSGILYNDTYKTNTAQLEPSTMVCHFHLDLPSYCSSGICMLLRRH